MSASDILLALLVSRLFSWKIQIILHDTHNQVNHSSLFDLNFYLMDLIEQKKQTAVAPGWRPEEHRHVVLMQTLFLFNYSVALLSLQPDTRDSYYCNTMCWMPAGSRCLWYCCVFKTNGALNRTPLPQPLIYNKSDSPFLSDWAQLTKANCLFLKSSETFP